MKHSIDNAFVRVLVLVILILLCTLTRVVQVPAPTVHSPSPAISDAPPPLAVAVVREAAYPLHNTATDYDRLMALVGDARFVLLGEATHGTHEFYRERARITRRLIEEHGFTAVAIEGDWPDAEGVNQYVQGTNSDHTAEQALANFTRFPTWMWNNQDVRDFVTWLREYNARLPGTTPQIGFYGLDLYSLFPSADTVTQSLAPVDRSLMQRANERYTCFEPFRDDPLAYGRAAARRDTTSCEHEAVQQFEELQRWHSVPRLTSSTQERAFQFSIMQNARVVKNAETYFRAAYTGETSTWNLRDSHMADTLDDLAAHLGSTERTGKVVVWAHNTHVGDARATAQSNAGEWSLGQLMRERHNDDVVLVGFTTYSGSVIATDRWGEAGKKKQVRPALAESYEALFHDTGIGNFLLPLDGNAALAETLSEPRLERAIGVVYLPMTERASHYLRARLTEQFDAVIHIDTSDAVQPLAP